MPITLARNDNNNGGPDHNHHSIRVALKVETRLYTTHV
jgi:hypothetical protein